MAYLIYREHRVLQEVNLFQEAGYPHVDKRTVYGVRQVRLIKIEILGAKHVCFWRSRVRLFESIL